MARVQRFWEGAIRWLVRDPALTLLHIDLDRTEYRRGQTVSARVRTLHADYSLRGVAPPSRWTCTRWRTVSALTPNRCVR